MSFVEGPSINYVMPERGRGSGQVLSCRFSLVWVNYNFDRKCYLRGRGLKNDQFWRYIIYGQPQIWLYCLLLAVFQSFDVPVWVELVFTGVPSSMARGDMFTLLLGVCESLAAGECVSQLFLSSLTITGTPITVNGEQIMWVQIMGFFSHICSWLRSC